MGVFRYKDPNDNQWHDIPALRGDSGVFYGPGPAPSWARVWIDTTGTPSSPSIPAGGTTGQVCVKESNADYDAGWTTIPEPDLSWETETLTTNLIIYRQGNMRMLVASGVTASDPAYTLAVGDRPTADFSFFGLQGTTSSNRAACFFRVYSDGTVFFRTFSGAIISSGNGWGSAFWTVAQGGS